MKLFLLFILVNSISCFYAFDSKKKENEVKIQCGQWTAYLQLTSNDQLPFKLIVSKSNKQFSFAIQNAEEIINLSPVKKNGDSLFIDFPNFNSSLHFIVHKKTIFKGYWFNYNKGKNYKIPFYASLGYKTRFEETLEEKPADVNGKWKVSFDYETENPELSIGIFKQNYTQLSGTFLTETGDYRYLEGNQFGNQFLLSCFDGSHAFLFKAFVNKDTLEGRFLSGNHWEGKWKASKNDTFELRDPDSLTILKKNNSFTFTLKDLQGNDFSFPNRNFNNKVVIIQIMGTWCPNCMDETRFYKELYDEYHSKGLEIISIGYETGDNFDDYARKISLLKNKQNLDFTFLVGGSANKKLASEQFSMLNEVISFPTSIYIGRDGTIKRIHTGFNGPGTGIYYEQYTEKTRLLIDYLLQN